MFQRRETDIVMNYALGFAEENRKELEVIRSPEILTPISPHFVINLFPSTVTVCGNYSPHRKVIESRSFSMSFNRSLRPDSPCNLRALVDDS